MANFTLNGNAQGWVDTGMSVTKDHYWIVTEASNWIGFAVGGYHRNPDGADQHGNVEAPAVNYDNMFGKHPAPGLRKNSLVVGVGSGWFQGGMRTAFHCKRTGAIQISNNDNFAGDNGGSWDIALNVWSPYVQALQDFIIDRFPSNSPNQLAIGVRLSGTFKTPPQHWNRAFGTVFSRVEDDMLVLTPLAELLPERPGEVSTQPVLKTDFARAFTFTLPPQVKKVYVETEVGLVNVKLIP